MPLEHIGLNVPDLVLAREYYDGLMPLVGFEPLGSGPDWFAYAPAEGPGTRLFFNAAADSGDYSRLRAGLQHLGFLVGTRGEVHAAHEWALRQSSEILHAPQLWPQYHPDYYAVFWADPHGFKLEVFCADPPPTPADAARARDPYHGPNGGVAACLG